MDNISAATRRLSDLIQNMLKLNKLENQTITPSVEIYDVCAQLCECAVQFEEQWEQKNIEFDADLEDNYRRHNHGGYNGRRYHNGRHDDRGYNNGRYDHGGHNHGGYNNRRHDD